MATTFCKGSALLLGLGLLLAAPLLTNTAAAESPALAICSASDNLSSTGRQYATVTVSPRDPSFCVRRKLGGEAPMGVPSCWDAARQAGFFCTTIVDEN